MTETKTRSRRAANLTDLPRTETTSFIDMKTAVQTAMAFTKDLLPEAKEIRLEEVKPSSEGWSVVISYLTSQSPTFAVLRGEAGPRAFKEIVIDKSGRARSLKVWK